MFVGSLVSAAFIAWLQLDAAAAAAVVAAVVAAAANADAAVVGVAAVHDQFNQERFCGLDS